MLFDFRLRDTKRSERRVGSVGSCRAIAALLVVVVMLAFFVWRAVKTRQPGWLVFVAFFLLLTLAFGPYARWIKNRYRLALTQDGTIIVHSVINAIPRAHRIDAAQVTKIVRAPLTKEQSIWFLAGDRKLGRFNDRQVPKAQLTQFYELLRQRYPQIDVPEHGPSSPKNWVFGLD